MLVTMHVLVEDLSCVLTSTQNFSGHFDGYKCYAFAFTLYTLMFVLNN